MMESPLAARLRVEGGGGPWHQILYQFRDTLVQYKLMYGDIRGMRYYAWKMLGHHTVQYTSQGDTGDIFGSARTKIYE